MERAKTWRWRNPLFQGESFAAGCLVTGGIDLLGEVLYSLR